MPCTYLVEMTRKTSHTPAILSCYISHTKSYPVQTTATGDAAADGLCGRYSRRCPSLAASVASRVHAAAGKHPAARLQAGRYGHPEPPCGRPSGCSHVAVCSRQHASSSCHPPMKMGPRPPAPMPVLMNPVLSPATADVGAAMLHVLAIPYGCFGAIITCCRRIRDA